MGRTRKHLRCVVDHILHLMGTVGKILANAVRIIRCDQSRAAAADPRKDGKPSRWESGLR